MDALKEFLNFLIHTASSHCELVFIILMTAGVAVVLHRLSSYLPKWQSRFLHCIAGVLLGLEAIRLIWNQDLIQDFIHVFLPLLV